VFSTHLLSFAMLLSAIDILDLFIRFFIVGQLSILCMVGLSKRINLSTVLAALFALCLSAYLLLTTPIPNHHYGMLRGILLFFTEILPYLLWCFAFALLDDDFHPKRWPVWIKSAVVLVLIWFLYLFGYLQGVSVFHQANHFAQLICLVHVIYFSIKGLADDLVNGRRNVRLLLVTLTSVYLVIILMFEFGDASLRDSVVFSLSNGLFVLVSTSVISWCYFSGKFDDATPVLYQSTDEDEAKDLTKIDIPVKYERNFEQLKQVMNDGFYKESQLSITLLANKLTLPEHQLRDLINNYMGYKNFSEFLNSYRLPAACLALEDKAKVRLPILSIALELGYGSVGTFNRAFKAKMGKTPKEYRLQFQK